MTPIVEASNGNTYITRKHISFAFKSLWIILFIFEMIVMSFLVPLSADGNYINDERYNETAMSSLQEAGLLEISWTLNKGMGIFHALVCVGLSAVLIWRNNQERVAILFSFIILTFATSVIPNPVDILPTFVNNLNELLYNIGFLALIYLFPDGRFFPGFTRFIFGTFIIGFSVAQLTIANVGDYFVVYIAMIVFGVGTMILRYRQAPQQKRQQMKWLVNVLIFIALLMMVWIVSILGGVAPWVQTILGLLGSALFISLPLSVGLAVLRYGLWNVDLVINQSLVYGTATVGLIVVFVLGTTVMQQILGATNTVAAFIVSAIPPILLFNPARKSLQNLVDHRIYGLRYNLNQVAAAQKPPEIKNAGLYTGKRFGKYEALDVIGRGGMGEVYKGFTDGETVAIKILPADLAQSDDAWKRFEREAQILQKLQHPNIVRWYASGVSDGIAYLVMEHVTGEELSAVIKRGRLTDYESLLDWMSTLSSALDYAHKQGFVHRDLKPSNIMLRQSDDNELLEAVLMDFGIARTLATVTNLTGTGALGTIDYMAPEQILDSKEVDKRADIYALGVILYELLTGERPYKGSAGHVLFAHLQQPTPDPRNIDPNISDYVVDVIEKAMSKNANDRYSSTHEFLESLKLAVKS